MSELELGEAIDVAKRYTADGLEKGVCSECGAKAVTWNSTKCADHRIPGEATSHKAAPAPKPSSHAQGKAAPAGAAAVARPARPGRGAPTADEWASKFLDKTAILITALIAGSMVRRYNVNDPDDRIADSLTMTSDEAHSVARPLARVLAGSQLSKNYGRKVIDNSDLLDAGFALYDYFERVNSTLRGMAVPAAPLASVTPFRTAPEAPTPEGGDRGPTDAQVEQPGIPLAGFEHLTGANFMP